jgi:exopolyphosphatase/guanosine-5'-triphosphate,3'-diphosphate pyrophosphatase
VNNDVAPGGELVAALDLGSNSFHMIVGRLSGGQLHIVDKMREPVRLGAGLDHRRNLTPEAQRRALEVLGRMGQRVRDMPPNRVRIVGTNTLRQARNAPEFLERAHQALGHPIEVIAGREEARLIYLGVSQTMTSQAERRLVVDIGGGSTECIIGEKAEILEADSLFMGCVSWTMRFFGDGELSESRFVEAEIAAKLELEPIIRRYRSLGWEVALGCSGTVHAIKRLVRANGWSTDRISHKGVRRLRKALISAGQLSRVELLGLTEDRRPVLPGGVAILGTIFEAFQLEELSPAPGALREGALYDLVGRIRHEDVRDRTIRWLCRHYGVEMAQVARVERTALRFLPQVAEAWALPRENAAHFLSWAAHLHEIGLSLSHTGYHKHSAYLVANADMAGFSKNDQVLLALLIRGHRRKLRDLHFEGLEPDLERLARRLTVLFRLAVLLNRGRSDDALPPVLLEAKRSKLTLQFPRGWLELHPMTWADLEEQRSEIRRIGVRLSLEGPRHAPPFLLPRSKRGRRRPDR